MNAITESGAVDIVSDARDTLKKVEEVGRDQQFALDNLVELLRLVADDGGQASEPSLDTAPIDGRAMQGRWLRVEYLANCIKGHVEQLTTALDGVEELRSRVGRAAA